MMKNNNKKKHIEIIDVARGFAIFLMFIYHFSYDLNYFGYIHQVFTQDPFWIAFRTLIVTLFLTIMGISLYLASYRGLRKKSFRRRLLLLVFYAALVSFGSWTLFPHAMILFGILHFIAVATVLGLLFIRLGILNLFLGITVIVLAKIIHLPAFDPPALQWIGFTTHLPVAVDYVPMFPWFGVVLIGIYFGQRISQLEKNSPLIQWRSKHPINKLLLFGGRHSLNIYMLHQPLFLGILYIINLIIS